MTAPELEIKQAAAAYYAQSKTIKLTATDFAEWLLVLPSAQREWFAEQGFEAACVSVDFQRFCLEWRGLRMRDYFVQCLSYEAYCYWSVNH